MAALSEEDEDQKLMESAVDAGETAVALVGTEDQSDDEENYKSERQKYINDLENWRESLLE
jgi:phosphosulfolactate synthase (CoM biosynthesis protein A)